VAIPVHGIDGDRCKCGQYPCGRDNTSAGKHPVGKRWQEAVTPSGPDRWALWGEHPEMNIGILTGRPSGFFVLDIDPKADGLAELARLTTAHGALPATYTVRTGSGGRHFYFAMPLDGSDVRNNARKIGHGIDIRGTGGMVVAPPSVSGVGAYELVDGWVPELAQAPAWLLELLAVPPATAPTETVVIEDLIPAADLDMGERIRVQRYAESVVGAEVTRYATAPPGTGNGTLYEAACNVIEIAQSPWNTVTVADVYDRLEAARRERLSGGGGQDPVEFARTFQSAQGRVVGRGRALPIDPVQALIWDPPVRDGGGQANQSGAEILEDFDLGKPMPSALERLRGRLHTRSMLDAIEPPVPLIEGVLDTKTMAVISGQFGTFKTFATLGWACSVATGMPWLGHKVVTQGSVLYVAAEGASGLKKRVKAWERASGVRVADQALQVLDVPVDLGSDEQCSALLTIAKEMGAVLVVIDTLHRCTPGMDENDNTDMGRITKIADILREHAGATTLYVHHAGHGGVRSRGASSIESDADTVWITRLTGDESRDPHKARRLEQRKTKDTAELDPFFVQLAIDSEADSGVLVLVDENGVPLVQEVAGANPFDAPPARAADPLQIQEAIRAESSVNAGLLLSIFADTFAHHSSGVTQASLRANAKARFAERSGWGPKAHRTTFDRAWDRLLALGAIEESGGGRWYVVPVEDRVPAPRPGGPPTRS
jgi:hypothetical protein